MKVITIKQPWASLIASGYKKYEFRTWKTNYRGPILIHAGIGEDKEFYSLFQDYGLEYKHSRIIAKADLIDCILINKEFEKAICHENELVYLANTKSRIGTYAWKLENVEIVNLDKEVKGKLGLWNYEIEKENT